MQCFIRVKYAEIFNLTVAKQFDIVAKRHPDKICFYFEDEEWTFRQVEELVNQVANYFAQKGLVKGDKVAIFMDNRVEYICLWLGLSKVIQ